MERPPAIPEETWSTFLRVYNAAPSNRRTIDVPTTVEEAQEAIMRMVDSAIEARAGTTSVDDSGRAELFKPSDPPSFTRTEHFNEYYVKLRFFMRGVQVSDNRCKQACFLILARWEGAKLSEFAQEVDAGTLALSNWADTQDSILQWLNTKFRSKTDLPDAIADWTTTGVRLRKKHFSSAADFYINFETALNSFKAACLRNKRTPPGGLEIMGQFTGALPPTIAARVRENHPDFDEQPYETYRSQIARTWEALTQESVKVSEASVKRAREEELWDGLERACKWTKTSEDGKAGTVQRSAAFIPRGTPRKGYCKETWEGAPPELLGQIYYQDWMSSEEEKAARKRHDRVKNANVCARCRKPKSQGHLQDTFMPVEGFRKSAQAKVTEVQYGEEREEDFHDAEE